MGGATLDLYKAHIILISRIAAMQLSGHSLRSMTAPQVMVVVNYVVGVVTVRLVLKSVLMLFLLNAITII